MSYTHLNEVERVCIFHQKGISLSNAEIARRLKRHRGTIGRELKRFHRHPSWPYYRQYFPDGAERLARERRARPRGFRWTAHRPLLAYMLAKLRQEEVVRKILQHCGLWHDPPARAPPRPAPNSQPVRPTPALDPGFTREADLDFLDHIHREEFDQPDLPWES